jgi:hypothetical protein
MRYQPNHAAPRDSVPFMLRGPKSLRTVLSAAVAGAIGLTPAFMLTSPAQAVIADYTFDDSTIAITEGSDLVFTLERDEADADAAEELTWTVAGSGGNAADEDDDVSVKSGTVEFAEDDTSETITIGTVGDTIDEENETFELTVTDDDDATKTATGTITDDDAAPGYTLIVNDPSPSEDLVAEEVTVTAELDEMSGKPVTIPISTTAGTAKAGQDYTTTTGTISFAANSTVATSVDIPIIDDPLYEENEQAFTVKGGTSTTVTGTETATVTITDDEEQSEVEIDPDTVAEGGTLGFDVTLSPASERAVTATWTTADGPGADEPDSTHDTAKAGSDYTAGTGTVTFPAATSNLPAAGATAQTVSVKTTSDSFNEATEDMHVTLSNANVGTLGDDTEATGAITDNDPEPTATLSPTAAITEGNSGRTTKTYTVKLNRESGQTVSVDYEVATSGGSATEVEDFFATTGTLTFAPGETTKTFNVDVVGDTTDEPNGGNPETFKIDLSSSTADVDGNGVAGTVTVSINDDDPTPTFSVAPITMDEGDAGSVVVFPVKLSNPSSAETTFTLTTTPGTATDAVAGNPAGDIDYIEPTGPVKIPAGQTTGYLYFLVNGDEVYEANEQMTVNLDPSANITAGDQDTTLTITNDDDAPSFEVTSITGNENDTLDVMGVVTGVAQANTTFNVNFAGASVDGSTAASSNDFTNPGTVPVTITGGTLSGTPKLVTNLKLNEDTAAEGPETILASGNAVNGTVVNGVVTIAASDGWTAPPTGPASITLSAQPFRIGPGPIVLHGKTDANTAIQLWSAPYNGGNDDWAEDGPVAKSDSNGNFTFNRSLTTTGKKYVVHAGATKSEEVKVALRQAPGLSASSRFRGIVQANVTGGTPFAKFIIQRQDGTKWTNVFSDTLTSKGTYNKALTGQASGRAFIYRVYIYGNSATGVQPSTSSAKRVTVR